MTYVTKKLTLSDNEKQLVERKMAKLDTFFTEEATAAITFTVMREEVTVEVTVKDHGMIFRGERSAIDKMMALDEIIDLLIRQVRKNKTRLSKTLYEDLPDFDPWEDGEDDFNLVKTKEIFLRPMDLDEAIMQMNLLDHNFFMFLDSETDKVSVVYRRKDGQYGLLRSEN
ncbi:MAG: ribosome-associated translation inhibitor RaiA, partial [Clostridia bacterium]|nr:ribosome-associated translation inhibitor RaiA [Clostridia bacterium]